MKKKKAKVIFAPVFFVLLAAFAVACDKKVPEPINPVVQKGHGEPHLIQFTFRPGILAEHEGIWGSGFAAQGAEKTVFSAEYNGKGVLQFSEAISLKKGQWYELKIDFYNKAKERINHEFITPEQQLMHQFFFRSFENKGADAQNKRLRGITSYKYADTDKDGKRLDLPIGFTGYFRIEQSATVETFRERVTLVHVVPPASKTDQNGKPYPFNEPATYLLGITDIDIRIPIHIKE